MGLYFDTQEILPFLNGDHRFNKANDKINKFSSLEVEVRALIEGQFIAKRAYAEDIGCVTGKFLPPATTKKFNGDYMLRYITIERYNKFLKFYYFQVKIQRY